MSGYLELEGKRALVTGGTKGVGAAVVAALREAGARVLTTARKRPEDVSKVEFVAADVATAEGCAAVADAVRKQLGGIDILVHVVVDHPRQPVASRCSMTANGTRRWIRICSRRCGWIAPCFL